MFFDLCPHNLDQFSVTIVDSLLLFQVLQVSHKMY